MSTDIDIRQIPGWIPLEERTSRPMNKRTIRNPNTRIRRNDMCPCGSKKKAKWCCLVGH